MTFARVHTTVCLSRILHRWKLRRERTRIINYSYIITCILLLQSRINSNRISRVLISSGLIRINSRSKTIFTHLFMHEMRSQISLSHWRFVRLLRWHLFSLFIWSCLCRVWELTRKPPLRSERVPHSRLAHTHTYIHANTITQNFCDGD